MNTMTQIQAKAEKTPSFFPVPSIVNKVLKSKGQLQDNGNRTFTKPRFGHDLSRISVSPAQPGILQASLVLGQLGDRFEKEADHVADLVMRFPVNGGERTHPPIVSNGFESLRRTSDEDVGNALAAQGEQTEDGANAGGNETESSPEHVAAMLLETDEPEGSEGAQSGEQTTHQK
ncbi:MAG: hypothetical protein MUO76_23845, partial [Anaerolineaceae bacterium]|nr:hypothetical protein [Anaerolineaceae bacterium]